MRRPLEVKHSMANATRHDRLPNKLETRVRAATLIALSDGFHSSNTADELQFLDETLVDAELPAQIGNALIQRES